MSDSEPDDRPTEIWLPVDHWEAQEDMVVHRKPDHPYFQRSEGAYKRKLLRELQRSWDGQCHLIRETDATKGEGLDQASIDALRFDEERSRQLPTGRACICSAARGALVSLALRKKAPKDEEVAKAPGYEISGPGASTGWDAPPKDLKKHPEFPFGIDELCNLFWEGLYGGAAPEHTFGHQTGLVVVFGETGAGKSQVAQGLIAEHLRAARAVDSAKYPHLVTVEDPIEKPLCGKSDSAPATWGELARKAGFAYTPRTLNTDTPSIGAALKDALRQKPSVVYVGEVREDRDWRAVLEFAVTGHLIVTTGHAGSLSEAMGRILTAYRATSASQRGDVGRRILALFHLRPAQYELESKQNRKVQIPTMWVRGRGGSDALVADGLASIVPRSDWNGYSIGRLAMVDQLATQLAEPYEMVQPVSGDKHEYQHLREVALRHDLLGT